MMHILMAQLIRHEGAVLDEQGRHRAYRCPKGKLTIGYGHNLDANPIPGLNAKSRISEEDARAILASDISRTWMQIQASLPWLATVESNARKAALINMAFNLGLKGLLGFKKALEHMKHGRWEAAGYEMRESRWAIQVGQRARELAFQMETGEFIAQPNIPDIEEIRRNLNGKKTY